MANDLNSVKTSPRDRYHHGALREALVKAATELLAERGLDGFSLRETARRAGVSPSAPSHHFGDMRGLLTAVATAAYADFAEALIAGTESGGADRTARLHAQGMAYVRFALAHPARFDLMWRRALIDTDDPAYVAASRRAFEALDRLVRGGAGEDRPSGELPGPGMSAPVAAWSMVHGFARLALDGVFGTEPEAPQRAADQLLPLVLKHLDV
jgi:AcrR family transcriptional regulator